VRFSPFSFCGRSWVRSSKEGRGKKEGAKELAEGGKRGNSAEAGRITSPLFIFPYDTLLDLVLGFYG
jgi:hypothetical protein